MTYSEMLDYYTKEYEKYIEMGLSKEDALVLVEKHVKENKQIKKASPYDLINLFAGYDVWKDTFSAFESEMESLLNKVTECLEHHKEEKKEETPSMLVKKCKDGVTEIIANTPKHKEFRVTYPNGYYKYKMLVK